MIIINLVKSGALVITGLVATRASDLFFKRKALEKKIGDYIKYPVDLTRIKKECTGVKRSLNPCFKISKWQKNRILKEKQLYELFLAYGPFIYKYGGFDMMQESIKKFDKALNRYKPMEFNPQPSTPTSTTNKILRVSTTEQYIPNKRKLFNKKNKNAYAVRHKLNKEWIKKGQFGPFAYCKNKSEEKRPISFERWNFNSFLFPYGLKYSLHDGNWPYKEGVFDFTCLTLKELEGSSIIVTRPVVKTYVYEIA